MKRSSFWGWSVVGIGLISSVHLAFSQGSLAPPGPPGPTFKTLQQVEPRTAITNLPYTISQPGSYYLTTNLTGVASQHGITISASGVTLDLMGFELAGVAGSLDGVLVSGTRTNITIRNGTVRGWTGSGVTIIADNVQIEALRVTHNTSYGIHAGENSRLEDCAVSYNGGIGIRAYGSSIVTDCTAQNNGDSGIVATGVVTDSTASHNGAVGILGAFTISRCVANHNGTDGISGNTGSVVSDCTAFQNTDNGIRCDSGGTISGCSVGFNVGDGIEVGGGCRVVGNTCSSNGNGGDGAGIHVTGGNNHIESNRVSSNDRGLDVDSGGNYIADNTVRGNTDNYDIAAGNQVNILLGQLPESIDWPATVVLAGSLNGVSGQNGITITADDVTVDLGGHSLIGVSGSLDGINVSGVRSNVSVHSGSIRAWGGDGIDAVTSQNGRFESLVSANNGGRGLVAGARTTVTKCVARLNAGNGIEADLVSVVRECTTVSNTGTGIVTGANCHIERNLVNANTGGGIRVDQLSFVTGNNCDFHGTAFGILVVGADNRIDGNTVTRSGGAGGRGIDVDGTGNLIIRNSASGNVTDYDIVAGNTIGEIFVGSSGITSVTVTNISPWANFRF